MSKKVEHENLVPYEITNKDLRGVFTMWFFSTELSNSYERLQALAFCNAIATPLRKLYPDDKDYSQALKRHLTFYNSEGTFGSIIHGVTLSMEEQKAHGVDIPEEMITGIKTGLMGPIAGIGDTIIWGTLKAIFLGLASSMALEGNPFSALVTFLFPLSIVIIGYNMLKFGYRLGRDSVVQLMQSGTVNKIITASSVLGLFMMGALSSAYVKVKTPLVFEVSATDPIILQDKLDALVPGLLPLAAILGIYYYFRKEGANYNKVIIIIIASSMLAAFLGLLG